MYGLIHDDEEEGDDDDVLKAQILMLVDCLCAILSDLYNSHFYMFLPYMFIIKVDIFM
jgi:hypothetical protein